MILSAKQLSERGLLLLGRLHYAVGWPGIAGLGAMALAAALVGSRPEPAPEGEIMVEPLATAPAEVPGPEAKLRLPTIETIPLWLRRLQRAAEGNNLEWRQADYKSNAAGAEWPANLEIHTQLKGRYLDLRRFLGEARSENSALALRSLTLRRTDIQTPELEADVVLVIYFKGSTGAP